MSWAYDANGLPTWVPWVVGEASSSQVIQWVGGKWIPATLPTSAPTNASYVVMGADGTLTDERVLTTTATVAVTDGGAGSTVTLDVPDNAITDAKLRQSAGWSVIGRSASSTGDVADITAASDNRVLATNGSGAVDWVTVKAGMIANNAVTDAKLRTSAALSVVGRSANSTGNVADISATAASGAVLRESGSTLGFGTVGTAGLAANAVTDAIIRQGAAHTLIGRSANSTGNVADISLATDEGIFNVAGVLTSQKTKLANIDATVQSPAQGTEGTRKIYTSTPANIGTAGSAGSSVQAAAGDHTHAHGAQTDGTLHAAATTSTAGFMSTTQVTSLNALQQSFYPFTTFPSYGTVYNTSFFMDFLGGANSIAPLVSSNSGTGSGLGNVAQNLQTRSGIVAVTTGTTTTGSAGLWAGSQPARLGGGVWSFRMDTSISAVSNGTDTYTLRIGFIDSLSVESTNGVFLRYTHSVNSGQWVFVARDNGSETTSNGSTAPATSIATTQSIEIQINAAGNSATAYVNGVQQGSALTALPTASTRYVSPGAMILKSAGTTSRYFTVDALWYSFNRTTAI